MKMRSPETFKSSPQAHTPPFNPQMRSTGTVYLIAQPSVKRDGTQPNISALGEHGRVQVLLETGERPNKFPQRALSIVRRRLSKFNPETDFICWVGGDTLAAVIVGHVLSDMSANQGWNSFRWLRYERRKLEDGTRVNDGGYYEPVEIPLVLPEDEIDNDDDRGEPTDDDTDDIEREED